MRVPRLNRGAAYLVMLAVASCSGRTGVRLEVRGDASVVVDQLRLLASFDGNTPAARTTAAGGTPLSLPQDLVVELPDGTMQADFVVSGLYQGALVAGGDSGLVTLSAHHMVSATVTLVGGGGAPDLGGASDLPASTTVHDLAARDLATPRDLATARDLAGADLAKQMVALRTTASACTTPSQAPKATTIATPSGTVAGDFLLAELAVGATGNATAPVVTAPTGWTLLDRIDQSTNTLLAIYWRVAGAAEPASYTWTTDEQAEGCGFIAAFTGVDAGTPFNVHKGVVTPTSGTAYATPSVTTTVGDTLLVASFAAHGASAATWTLPTGTTQLVSLSNTVTRSLFASTALQATAAAAGPFSSTASSTQDYALTYLLALAPGP